MQAKLTNRELITFCDQLYLIIHSGISALEGIAVMRDDAQTKEAEKLLDEIYQELELTGNLTESLRGSGVFPDYMLHMVALGEQTGNLDEIFASLRDYYEREENIAAGIRSAVLYPVIMLGIMFAVVIVLLTKVMPIFAQVFEQLGSSMTGFSEKVIQLGMALNRYSLVFVVILAVIVCLCLYFACVPGGRARIRRAAASVGPTGKIAEKIACARFAEGMAMSLSAGLDVDESMNLVSDLVEQERLKNKVAICREKLAEGAGFAVAMAEAGIFSGMHAHMMQIGFRTGSLDEVMRKVADQYEEEADTAIQNTLSVLEPTLVAVLAVVVGIILLSVMLPLVGIMSGIGA